MKTAISIPDALFLAAEEYARECRISRSELYRAALAEYLRMKTGRELAEQIDRICEKLDTGLPEPVKTAVYRKFAEVQW
ncbi:MAG: hypothetical protein AB7S75_12880 [Desulfococcaceae bacterium]